MEQTTQEQLASVAAFVQPSLRRLTRLAELPTNWDSYGAAPPSLLAISMARELLLAIDEQFGHAVGERVQPYAVAPIADGGIQLEWRGPRAEIEVEIDPMGQQGYLVVAKQGVERTFEEKDNLLRAEVVAAVAKVLLPLPDNAAHSLIEGENSRARSRLFAEATSVVVQPSPRAQ